MVKKSKIGGRFQSKRGRKLFLKAIRMIGVRIFGVLLELLNSLWSKKGVYVEKKFLSLLISMLQ